jgi:hypothetical protein
MAPIGRRRKKRNRGQGLSEQQNVMALPSSTRKRKAKSGSLKRNLRLANGDVSRRTQQLLGRRRRRFGRRQLPTRRRRCHRRPGCRVPARNADNSYDVDYDPPCTGLLDRAGPVPCWVPVTAVQTRKAGGSRRGRNTCRLGSVEMWLSSKYFEGPGTVSIICEKLHMGHDTVLHVLINVLVCIREARRTGAAPCGERWAQQGHAAGQCR